MNSEFYVDASLNALIHVRIGSSGHLPSDKP